MQATIGALAPEIERFDYDRAAQAVGIVHFGIGAFHRAHQAWYTDAAMNGGDRGWAIIGVSLRSANVARQLNPQNGLYTVSERSESDEATRLVGSVRQTLVAAREPDAVIAALAAPTVFIASFTVTEKGYGRSPDGGLDPALSGAGSFYPLIAAALRRRHDSRLPGLTLLSCDNLTENGRQLAQLMGEYLDRHDPGLSQWFAAECACPSTMVDRIVPATTEADRANLARRIGLEDQGAVMTEPFSQWVIEDRFAQPRPRWEAVGAETVADVRPYEKAKLRMLNGAHSLLAYCGLERGHRFVHEAVADPELHRLVRRLLLEEAAPSIHPAPGQDLGCYAERLITRFANPALHHRLAQIAIDGSQKIPQRWLETLATRSAAGAHCPAILTGLAAWLRHARGDRWPVEDPIAASLADAWRTNGTAGVAAALFGPGGLLAGTWKPDTRQLLELTTRLKADHSVSD